MLKLYLLRRLEIPRDPLDDYHIEIEVAYILKESDPEFDPYEDNILTERHSCDMPDDREAIFYEDLFETDFRCEAGDQFKHSYLLHDLMDHDHGADQPAIVVDAVLRIGGIRVNIKPVHQYYHEVDAFVSR